MTRLHLLSAALLLAACGGPEATTGDRCTSNADCPAESTCFSGLCRANNGGGDTDAGSNGSVDAGNSSQQDSGNTPFDAGNTPHDAGNTTPADTGNGGGGQCQGDCPCETESDCPVTHYCNRRDGQCAELPEGTCRDDSTCAGRCNVPEGRTVGRCIDCEVDADCAGQAPRTRCFNNMCRLPEGQCENNGDCENGQTCVDGACEGGGGGGGCNANNCPPPGQCVQDQCIGGGGGGIGDCTDHSDCDASQQCLDIGGMGMCMDRCNGGLLGPMICIAIGMNCDMATGLCEP